MFDVLIERLTETAPGGQSCPFHCLGNKIWLMGEHVKEIAWEQIAAESEILCAANEVRCTFGLHLSVGCVPFKETEYRILAQGIQYIEC